MILALILMILLTGGVTYWAVGATRVGAIGARFERYAGPAPAAPLVVGPDEPALRLPRPFGAFLAKAGVDWTPGQMGFVVVAHAVVGYAVGALIHLGLPGLLGALAFMVVRLRASQAKRTRQMAAQLPDALMLMASGLKGGLGFQQALQLVANEGPEPLAPELGRLANDLALGLPLEEALVRLEARLGSTDGEMLASALLVQRQTGGNLSEILLNLHDTIRDRQMVQGQVRTLTAQGRLSGIVLTAIPVCIGLAFYVLNRNYLMLLVIDPRGRLMSAGALVLFIIGVFAIRRIVSITL